MNNERIAYILIIIALLCISKCSYDRSKESEGVILQLSDSIKTSVNKYGELQSSKFAVMAEYNVLKGLSNHKDSLIAKLSRDITNRTIMRGAIAGTIADTVYLTDTAYVEGPCDTVKRIYHFNDSWTKFRITTLKDKAQVAYSIRPAYTIDISYRSEGLFKRRQPVVMVTDHNPNSEIRQLEFFVVKDRPVAWWEYALAGGAGFALGKL
jgi:hypothetical protein